MSRFTITAPADGFTGDVAGVYFRDGTASVDDTDPSVRATLAYCRRRGYAVALVEAAAPEPGQDPAGSARPKDYASKAEWVAYATRHPDQTRRLSDEAAHAMTKQELVDLFSDTDEGTSK